MWYRTKPEQHRKYSFCVAAARFLSFRSCAILWYNSPISLLLVVAVAGRRLQPALGSTRLDGSLPSADQVLLSNRGGLQASAAAKRLRSTHPEVAQSLNNLALLYSDLGLYSREE